MSIVVEEEISDHHIAQIKQKVLRHVKGGMLLDGNNDNSGDDSDDY